MGQFQHIAALGSSFAAGPGIAPLEHRAAQRSARNYPHLLAERFGASLTDLTTSGATTSTVLDKPQHFLGHRFPPQLSQLPTSADLVTITVGGNDLHYSASTLRFGLSGRLAHPSCSAARTATRPLAALLTRGGVPVPAADDVERVASNLARVVHGVRRRASNARVVLVDYLTVLGPHLRHDRHTPFDPDTAERLRQLGESVAAMFSRAAALSEAELVAVSARSRDHGADSPQPWVSAMPDRLHRVFRTVPYHPNAAGMRAIADAVTEQLTADR